MIGKQKMDTNNFASMKYDFFIKCLHVLGVRFSLVLTHLIKLLANYRDLLAFLIVLFGVTFPEAPEDNDLLSFYWVTVWLSCWSALHDPQLVCSLQL